MKRLFSSAVLAAVLFAPVGAYAETAKATLDPLSGGDAAAGATKAATCVACHGPGGNSANAVWPKLAGQSPRYVVEQLKAFKTGARKDPLMSPMAAPLSDEDMKDLAAYFHSQKAAPGLAGKDSIAIAEKIYRAGDAARGLPACAACHGPKGAGNAAAAYPRLGGQHATYTAGALKRLRAGPLEPSASVNLQAMAAVAAKLSDAEIAALASYLNGLQ